MCLGYVLFIDDNDVEEDNDDDNVVDEANNSEDDKLDVTRIYDILRFKNIINIIKRSINIFNQIKMII